MRRMIFLICCILLSSRPMAAQESEEIKYMVKLLAVEPEELDEDEVERLSALLKRPISLNIL